VTYLGRDRARVIDHVIDITRPGDLVITTGAGDVSQLGAELLLRLDAGALGGRTTC
jgi:UDP-N-acetylmuramate-alanine ligase